MKLKTGDQAPDFSTIDQNGNEISLRSFKGQKIVLYFYPKDNTPTCTEQACNIRDNYSRFISNGYKVFGISINSKKSHQNFIKKFDLPFDLLVDENNAINELYGVWAEKQMYGKKYMGTLRTTFLINEDGIIENIIENVKAKEHSNQIFGE